MKKKEEEKMEALKKMYSDEYERDPKSISSAPLNPTEDTKLVGKMVDIIIVDEADVCNDCHGGYNSLGIHLDCRTCNNTGIKPTKE